MRYTIAVCTVLDSWWYCAKHEDFYSNNKFRKFVHLVGFNIRTGSYRNLLADRILWRSNMILKQKSDYDKYSTLASVCFFEAGLNYCDCFRAAWSVFSSFSHDRSTDIYTLKRALEPVICMWSAKNELF